MKIDSSRCCVLFWRQTMLPKHSRTHMDKLGPPKKVGRPLKYATEAECRIAKTAQRREQRRRQQGSTKGSVGVQVDVAVTSMYVFHLRCRTPLMGAISLEGMPWPTLLFLWVQSNELVVHAQGSLTLQPACAQITIFPAVVSVQPDLTQLCFDTCSGFIARSRRPDPPLVDCTGDSTVDCLAVAGEFQTLSPMELQEKKGDLKLLLDADEEYIETLEQRNENLWDAVQNLEERLCESGVYFQPFHSH